MRKLTKADLPAIYPIYFTVSPRAGREKVTGSIDTAIADLFGIDEKPFSTSMDASYELLDALVAGDEYTNVDYREYRNGDGTFSHILCDINDDTDGTDFHGYGRGMTRAEALFKAVVSGLTGMVESIEED